MHPVYSEKWPDEENAGGQKFVSDMEVRQCLAQQLTSFFFASGTHKVVERWDNCLNKLEGYVEK